MVLFLFLSGKNLDLVWENQEVGEAVGDALLDRQG